MGTETLETNGEGGKKRVRNRAWVDKGKKTYKKKFKEWENLEKISNRILKD